MDLKVLQDIEILARDEVKSAGASDGRLYIRSLASTPDIDDANEIVEPEAFRNTLAKFAKNPVMLFCHDMRQPCGMWDKQEITSAGLILEGWISSARQDVQTLVRDGVVKKASIGYRVNKYEASTNGDEPTRLLEVDLYEVSLVPLPANDNTYVATLSKGIRSLAERARGGDHGEPRHVVSEQNMNLALAEIILGLTTINARCIANHQTIVAMTGGF